jgi:succinate dehydrogenase / fumarate reductase cytochrome b subunit
MAQVVPPVETRRYRRTLYRGGGGMWSWMLHRGSGLAVLAFLFLHILDTSLIGFGAEHYNKFVKIYQRATFRWLEVLLMGMVIYHSFNGVRIVLVDFWTKGARHQIALGRAVGIISLAMFLPAAYFMLKPIFE